jgi:hypothetical protein
MDVQLRCSICLEERLMDNVPLRSETQKPEPNELNISKDASETRD